MKKSLFIALLLCVVGVTTVLGQTITFGYDSAGNRVSRVINYPQLRAEESDEEEITAPVVYEEMLSEMIIKIAPNPTEGLLRVTIENLPAETFAQLYLYSLQGKLIDTRKEVSSTADFNISHQPAGIYVLRIVAGEQKTEWKIIKK